MQHFLWLALIVVLNPGILGAADNPPAPMQHPPGLRFVEGPPGDLDVVTKRAMGPPDHLNPVDMGHMEVLPPLPLYTLTELDLAQQKDMTAATRNPYFYYIVKSNGVAARKVGLWQIKGVAQWESEGSNIDMVWISDALDKLTKLEELKKDSYEVRLLQCGFNSNLSFEAIWLKADKPDGDLIYIISRDVNYPTHSIYETEKFYHPKELFDLARPVAREMLSLPSAPINWTADDQMHAYFLKRFLQAQGMGMSRMAAPSLAPDDTMQLVIGGATPADSQKNASSQAYQIKRVELIGIAFHDPAVLFRQELYHRPDVRPMQAVKPLPDTYRALTDSEQKMLTNLVTGMQDVVAQTDQGERVVFGAIRAQASCLECHTTAKTGDALGAFSYHLVPRTALAEITPAALPAK